MRVESGVPIAGSGFRIGHAPHPDFWIPDYGFRILLDSRLRIPNAGFRIGHAPNPHFWIPLPPGFFLVRGTQDPQQLTWRFRNPDKVRHILPGPLPYNPAARWPPEAVKWLRRKVEESKKRGQTYRIFTGNK